MAEERRFKNKWAFLVGVSNYLYIRSLRFAARDAERLRDALVDKLEFPRENVILVSDNSAFKPDSHEIWHRLGELARMRIDPDDLLVFHFSGHGVRDDDANEDRLLPRGATIHNLRATGISIEELVQKLRATGCRNLVLFLDMCREETEQDGAKALTKGAGAATVDWVKGREGMATFFSCDPREFSYEIESLEHGCFTHCLLQAIDDPEVNTIGEIDEYLRRHVPRINDQHKKKPQYPRLIPNPREIESLPLLQQRKRPGRLPGDGSTEFCDALIDRFNRGELSPALFALALQLADPDRGPKSPWEQAMLGLLKAYCAGRLPRDEVEAMYRWGQKQPLGKSPIPGPQSLDDPGGGAVG